MNTIFKLHLLIKYNKNSRIYNKTLQQILPRYAKIINFVGKFHLILGF